MRNLKVWQKLGILGLVFGFAFLLVTGELIRERVGNRVARMERSRAGVELYQSLITLRSDLQSHRDLTVGAVFDQSDFRSLRTNARQALDMSLEKTANIVNNVAGTLLVEDAWRTTNLEVNNAIASTNSVPDIYYDHTTALASIDLFIGYMADDAGWREDMNATRSRLSDVLQLRGPKALELLSKARYEGIELAVTGQPASDDKWHGLQQILTEIGALLTDTNSSLITQLGKARDEDGIQKHMENRQALAESVQRLNRDLRSISHIQRKLEVGPDRFYEESTAAINELEKMLRASAAAMKTSLDRGIETAHKTTLIIVFLALFVLVAVSLFAYFVIRDITRPLQQLVVLSDRLAGGDLTINVPFEDRRDELGVLMSSFNGMVSNLNRIVSQVQKSGVQVNTSINQISVTGREQQTAAQAIADTTSDIGETANRISTTSQELVNMMSDAFTVTEDTTRLASQGQAGLTRMRDTMQQITEAASLIHTKLDVLNEKAGNINLVITTITKIADRTNLLSLNAAIEAEKAGEYGRGFSVVATEIRRLADQTTKATNDIELMVKEMQAAVTTGVLAMNKYSDEVKDGASDVRQISEQLDQIIQQVQALTPRFELVNEGVNSHATGGQQISDSLAQLSRTVKQTARSLEESNGAIEHLKEAAYGLRDGVSRFKLPK
ncbi:MAG: methyl-accepting chemotaxis protein WspA [Limisphaerales bacterium]|jgi:methyl-accepting chemotaxis protein WspA